MTESKTVNLIEFEKQYWKNQIGNTSDGSPLFDAFIDTTFSLINLDFFNIENELTGIRIGENYTATHLPWLKSSASKANQESLFSSLSIKNNGFEDQAAKIVEQNLYISYLKIQIENLNFTIQNQASELDRLYSSKSWKLTKPFRSLLKLLKIKS
jgi:hypothetical protein